MVSVLQNKFIPNLRRSFVPGVEDAKDFKASLQWIQSFRRRWVLRLYLPREENVKKK